jgi:hypothetical protein
MNATTDEYKKKVWDFLAKMQPGERYVINEICERENYSQFVDCIKQWMDQVPWQGGLNFNHDYSEIYIIHLPEQALINK